MRRIAALFALALTAVAATEVEHLSGDVWVDGLLQYRVIAPEEPTDATNGTSVAQLGAAIELMGDTAGTTNNCVMATHYTLPITISRCLDSSEYAKVWSILSWPVSSARLTAITYTYLPCSTAVGPPATTATIAAPPRIEFMQGRTTPTVAGAVAVRVCAALDCRVLSTDVVVSTLTGVDLAIPSRLRDAIDCPTLANSVSIREGVSGTCKCMCPENANIVGNVCTCPTGSTLQGGVCTCLGGQSLVAGVCTCPSTSTLQGGVCSCSGGQSFVAGVCTCPSTSTLQGGVCTCGGGQSLVAGVCTCPTGSTLQGGVCTCSGGQSLVAGVCTCPSTSTLQGGVCSCSGGQSFVAGVCTCPSTSTLQGGVCTCGGGQSLVGDACTCPSTSTLQNGVCKCPGNQVLLSGVCSDAPTHAPEDPACYWKANNAGFECLWANPDKTSLKLRDDCGMAAPLAKDNYVADKRDNKNDGTLNDPVISISATKEGESTGTSKKATWKEFFLSPATLENEITFSSFGVFDLLMVATDYSYSALCSGCVAIVDDFPPTALTKCQVTDVPSGPVLFTDNTLAVAIAEEQVFTTFYSSDNIVNNGAYDENTGANERCDDVSAKMQDFFATSESDLESIDTTCFDVDFVKHLLDSSLAENPLATYTQSQLNELQCTRCCSKSRTLREFYYDYKCGTSITDTEQEVATSDSCAFNYCLNMPSESLVTARASLTGTANDKTTTVIAGLPDPVEPDSKTVHRSITCTAFDGSCTYSPTLGELFARTSTWVATAPDAYDADDYVFWRYSVDTENWNVWSNDATLAFSEAESEVHVEAWTHCGLAFQSTFTVVLHPHSSHNACAAFNAMWEEDSPSPRTTESHYCTYPGSDFMVMTFEYDSASGATHDASTVRGSYTDVKCYVKVAESGALDGVGETELPLAWTPDVSDRILISKQLALELVHDPETAENTDVKVRCDFTFTHFDATTTETEPCAHEFTVTDCDDPVMHAPGTEVCEIGECEAPSGTPGPFEACGGSVFTTVSSASQPVTQMKSVEEECCDECSTALACTILTESAETNGVKRCEPAPVIPVAQLMTTKLTAEDRDEGKSAPAVSNSTALTLLLGASAMVAVMALLAAKKQKRDAPYAMSDVDDAYVSFLD